MGGFTWNAWPASEGLVREVLFHVKHTSLT
jgi:hypothetical protein